MENFIIQMYSHLATLEYLHFAEAAMFADFEGCSSRFQPSSCELFDPRTCSQGQVSFIRNHYVGSWRRAFNVASIEKFLSLLEKVVARPNSLFTCNQTKLRSKFDRPAITKNSSLFFFSPIFLILPQIFIFVSQRASF